jgi:hypothetical protein
MPELAMAGHDAPCRLQDDETQQFVLQTVATHAESLLRTAERHSLCQDDAHDAYQRGLEIFVRRVPELDRARVGRWLHVVTCRLIGTEHLFPRRDRLGSVHPRTRGGRVV